MGTFFLIAGIIITAIGIVAFAISDGDMGFGAIVIGLIIFAFSLMSKHVKKLETNKDETSVADSTKVSIPKDSIYAIQFIVSSKDTDGVYVGQGIKLIGRTEKNAGDTLTIQLK